MYSNSFQVLCCEAPKDWIRIKTKTLPNSEQSLCTTVLVYYLRKCFSKNMQSQIFWLPYFPPFLALCAFKTAQNPNLFWRFCQQLHNICIACTLLCSELTCCWTSITVFDFVNFALGRSWQNRTSNFCREKIQKITEFWTIFPNLRISFPNPNLKPTWTQNFK